MNKTDSLKLTLFWYVIAFLIGSVSYYLMKDSFSLLITTLIVNIIMTFTIFFASMYHNNSSLYDPYWSVIPVFIVLLWLIVLNQYSFSYILIFIAVVLWGLRLTTNWMIDFKGYKEEDFRYEDFRERFSNSYWLISLLAIHLFPTLIVFISMYPIYFVLTHKIINASFILIGVLVMITGTYISYKSDQQLRLHKETSPETSIRHGLWKYSRHPNYFGEVMFWVGVYILSLSVGISLVTPLGMIGMILLFNLYSVPKMESRLLETKRDYEEIKEEVPRFILRKK